MEEVELPTTKQGDKVFIRTVTHYYIGEYLGEEIGFVYLTHAAWVADTGYFTDAIAHGKLNEVEAYPEDMVVRVSIGAIVDFCEWRHELPKTKW